MFVLVAAKAPEPPIHMSTFFVVGDIGHERPTNLLGMDGPKRWWGSCASCSFEGNFWETIFLVEGYLLFVFLSFGSFG
jgi:hypothetical protein